MKILATIEEVKEQPEKVSEIFKVEREISK